MIHSPLETEVLFYLGPVPIKEAVLVSWALILLLAGGSFLLTRNLKLQPGRGQVLLEMLVEVLDGQIRDTMQVAPERFRNLIGTLFVFIFAANWSSLIPGIEPPTATMETDLALALIVFFVSVVCGVLNQGVLGYLRSFVEPSWFMVPLNIVEQLTRTFSMFVRLFGNIMSGVFVIGIALSLAGLLVPIPFMALDLLTGAIQAYIFSVLAMVFIGAALKSPH